MFVSKKDIKDELVTSHEMAERIKNMPPTERYSFGIDNVDAITDGFETGELILISGWTGYGKTTFCRCILSTMSEQKIPVLSISYEGKVDQFFRKLSDPTPYFCMPEKNKSHDILWLEERIQEAIRRYKIKVALIDHLDYIIPSISQASEYYHQVKNLLQQMKQWCIKYDIAIFFVIHTNKPPKGEIPPLPGLGDISGGTGPQREADGIYVIQRVTKKKKGYSSQNIEPTNDTLFKALKPRESGMMNKSVLLTYVNEKFVPAISREDEKAL